MTDDELTAGIRMALVAKGWVLPVTPEEVLVAEEAMKDEPPVELPESLRDPYELMRRHPEVFGRDVVARPHEPRPGGRPEVMRDE